MRLKLRWSLLWLLVLGSGWNPARLLAAPAVITVTTALDDAATDGACSLREALTNANRNTAFYPDCLPGQPGEDVITFEAALADQIIILTSGPLPPIIDDAILDGAPAPGLTISGNHAFRPFRIRPEVDVAIHALRLVDGVAQSGGAIHNQGRLELVGVTLENNQAATNFRGGYGGAVISVGELRVHQSIFRGNSAVYGGGGIYKGGGSLQVTDSIFEGNSASFGGGLANYNGPGEVRNTIFEFNQTQGSGGGIHNSVSVLSVVDSVLRFNHALQGGGIYNYAPAYSSPGYLYLYGGEVAYNTADDGGGLVNSGELAYTLVSGVVFHHNEVLGAGGAIVQQGLALVVENSTLSQNRAAQGGGVAGGGVFYNTTIAGNEATVAGGGAEDGRFYNVIIAGNRVNGVATHPDADCSGGASAGYNLLGQDTGCPITPTDTPIDPTEVFTMLLGPLADYGGETLTHALLPGSAALDAGDPAGCYGAVGLLLTDQRGLPRPVGAACDIGAYEAQ